MNTKETLEAKFGSVKLSDERECRDAFADIQKLLKRSKSAISKTSEIIGSQIDTAKDNRDQHSIDKVIKHSITLDEAYHELCTIMDYMAIFATDDLEPAMDKTRSDYTRRWEGANGLVFEFLDKARGGHLPQAGAHDLRVKPNEAYKPHLILTFTHSPVEKHHWSEQFLEYCHNCRIFQQPRREGQALLRQCVDSSVWIVIKQHFNNDTPLYDEDPTVNTCLSYLDLRYREHHPIIMIQYAFFTRVQEPGEDYPHYAASIKELSLIADLHNLTYDKLLIMRLLTGVSSQKMKDSVLQQLREEDFTYEQVDQAMRRCMTLEAYGPPKSHSANKTRYSRSKNQNQQSRPQNQNQAGGSNTCQGSEKMKLFKKKGICLYCAKKKHGQNESCPAKGMTCNSCGRLNHNKAACRDTPYQRDNQPRSNNRSQSRNHSRATSRASSVGSLSSDDDSLSGGSHTSNLITLVTRESTARDATPRQLMQFEGEGGKAFSMDVLPDSGTTKTIFAYNVIRKNRIRMFPTDDVLSNASGEQMDVSGAVRLLATFRDKTIWINGVVSKDLKDEVLVSWRDCENLGSITITRATTTTQKKKFDDLKKIYKDVLSDKMSPKPMIGSPMKIHLKPNVPITPKRISTAASIPIHFQEKAQAVIDQVIKDGVIEMVPENEPSEWCHRGFFVQKPDGGLRLVNDLSPINEYVLRPLHPFTSGAELVRSIKPTSRVFAKLDALSGYFQIPLDEESKKLTTFILPMGRFRYKRAPMGLNASSDEWCRRSDEALHGLSGCLKLVDDILVCAEDYQQLYDRLEAVLKRCREHHITLSLKKLEVGESVKFAGFQVSSKGVQPLSDRTDSIRNFPTPDNVQDVRSFLGLAQQLGHFLPDLAHVSEPIRELLKKNVSFQWTPTQEEAFTTLKNLLTSPMLVHHFDPSLHTELVTDASRLGLGFALIQRGPNGNPRLIQCGSKSLSDAETRYAVCELEGLAILYGIRKCRHYLMGHNGFLVITDHKPLKGVFSKDLSLIENARLRSYREKLTGYTFTLEWREGKTHLIADALSRNPVFPANDMPSEEAHICRNVREVYLDKTHSLDELVSVAKSDLEYQELVMAIGRYKSHKSLPPLHPGRHYSSVWHELSTDELGLIHLDDDRIIIPQCFRKEILQRLHRAHTGIVKTTNLAKSLYYWPTMRNDVKMEVEKCAECRFYLPSQPAAPVKPNPISGRSPMSDVGADLFHYNGKNYLVMKDRFSGLPFCKQLRTTNTSTVTSHLLEWFSHNGFPETIRTDGGPQFRGEFRQFCEKYKIKHELSSAHYHESNGMAEAGVKQCKHLLGKCKGNWNEFQLALLEYRNVPNETGYSPSQMFFGRRQRGSLPMLPWLTDMDVDAAENGAQNRRAKLNAVNPGILKPELGKGTRVTIQNEVTKRWDRTGEVMEVRESGQSYVINCDGKSLVRNRKFLRPLTMEFSAKNEDTDETLTPQSPRRSPRLHAPAASSPVPAKRRRAIFHPSTKKHDHH